MPTVNEMFPSRWLRAADVGDTKLKVTISHVTQEEFEDFKTKLPVKKWVCWMHGTDKGFVLNATNAAAIGDAYGRSEDWGSHQFTLLTVEKDVFGELKMCLAVKVTPENIAANSSNSNGAPPAQAPPAQQQEAPPVTTGPPVTVVAGNTVDGDDDLPF